MATINTSAVNNSIDNKSFALLRTNPKLTSNSKLLVNSNGDLFLSSFKANKELAKVEYQKYDIKSTGIYSIDIANFYGKLPLTQRYETLRASSDITLYSDYEFQYEDQYQYGAIQNTTKLYDEQYKIFAPIWLEKQVPTKFIIYRIEDVDYKTDYTEDTIGQNSRILELLKNATIIKTFDLGKSSKIGEYLNTHVNDKRFPNSMLTINFKESSQSTFNGIDIVNGGFATKTEQLDRDYIQVDYPEIFNNQTITNGFERNGVVSANIINLEFLFDDYTAENYKIYRYFGIYADDIDEGNFGAAGLDKYGQLSVKYDTYKTFYDLSQSTSPLVDIDMFPGSNQFQIPTLQYVKDKSGTFYNIKDSSTKLIHPANIGLSIPAVWSYKLQISKDGKEEDSFIGFAKNGKKITADLKKPSPKGFLKVTVKDVPSPNDRIFIGDRTELEISQYNLGDYLVIADPTLPVARAEENRFSTQGSLQQIAIALAAAINNGEIITYKTKVVDTSIIIEEIVAGNKRRQTAFGIYTLNLVDWIEVNNGEFNDIGLNAYLPNVWNIWTTIAGSAEGQAVFVKSSEIGNIQVGEYLKQKDSDKVVRIIEIDQDPFDTDYYRVILDTPTKLANDRVYEVYDEYKTIHGRFAAYDFKDFDFDFYSTRNSELGDLLYDKIRNPAYTGEIGAPHHGLDPFDPINPFDPFNPQDLGLGPTVGPPDQEFIDIPELSTFYAGLRDILSAETSKTVTKTELLNEYDRLKENTLKETALLSRVIPTICKYELKNASNARNLPYILNANEAFGDDNLSPNIELDSNRNVEYLNMEHFHLNRIPNCALGSRKDFNNYLDFANDDGLTVDKLKDTTFNYFDKHFNWTGYIDQLSFNGNVSGVWFNNKTKKLWSKFDAGNFEKSSSTVFRGLRYVFQKRKERDNAVPTEFLKGIDISDYKFGAYLSYNIVYDLDDGVVPSNSIVFNCVKNDKFKFICVNIELNVIENAVEPIDMNRYLLYTLKDLTLGTTPNTDPDINNGNPIPTIINTKIPFRIDFAAAATTSPTNQDEPFIINAHDFAINDGSAKFTEFIKRDSYGEYSWIYFDLAGQTWAFKVIDVIDDTSILVSGWAWEFNLASTPPAPLNTNRLDPIQLSLVVNTGPFYYSQGGANEFANLLDSISAYRYSKRFNSFGQVNYITITEDGTRVDNDFVLSVESGVDVVKPSVIEPKADPERPKAYRLSANQIGNIIQDREDDGYATILRRMNGDYNPIFNDIVTFFDIDSEKKVSSTANAALITYNQLNGKGIAFDSFKNNRTDYGFIKNYFYHKVNEQDSKNILKLSQTTDKLPLYPLIGEIAIDKKDINVFKSKYSKDYFTRALSAGESETTNGTLSPVEKKTFMNSTIMKVKDTYDITKFDSTQEVSIEVLDKIRFAQSNKTAIHWIDEESQVIADFYLPTAILNELTEDGIEQQFGRYVNPSTSYGDKSSIKDDLQVYSKANISPRFIIDSIKLYGIEGKGLETGFVSVTETSQLTADNFKELTNFNIQSYQNDGLSFRLIYNKQGKYSYNFKVHVKIQA